MDINFKKSQKIIFFTAFGFLFLWVDVCFGHFGSQLMKPAMWVPLVFLPLVFIAAFGAGFSRAPWVKLLFVIFCRTAMGVGITGLAFHGLRIFHDLKNAAEWWMVLNLLRNPPLLAPLAVSGVGLLGIWGSEWEK